MVSKAASGAGKAVAFAFGSVSKLIDKATEDGHLAAAGRQGIDEMGEALKPFPDSIQAHETGTIFNPTQGEVAADRKAAVYGHSSPAGQDGHSRATDGKAARRTPSEIAADRGGVHGPERGHGQDNGNDRGRGR